MRRQKRESCKGCLNYDRIEVPYDGPPDAELVICGEAPGHEEERKGRPFVQQGRSGAEIRKITAACGIRFEKAFIMNAARCLIDTENLTDSQIKTIRDMCRPNVEKALRIIKPKAILLLGNQASKQVLRRSGVKKWRGQWVWSDEFNCYCMITYHPAAILRDPSRRHFLEKDIQMVADFQAAGWVLPEKAPEEVVWREVQSIEALFSHKEKKGGRLLVSFDTETQGLDWMAENPVVLCYSLSWKEGTAVAVRLMEEAPLDRAEFVVTAKRVPEGKKKPVPIEVGVKRLPDFDRRMRELRRFCEDSSILKICQNGNYDIHTVTKLFERYYPSNPLYFRGFVFDTQVGAHLIDENVYEQASLEDLQQGFTNFEDDYWRRLTDKYSKDDMLSVARGDLASYAAADADITRRVGVELIKQLREEKRLWNYYQKLLHPALSALCVMEHEGVRVDRAAIPIVQKDIEREMSRSLFRAVKLIPKEVAADSKHKGKIKLSRPELIRDVLFSERGFALDTDGLRKTKTKLVSIDKETVKNLQSSRIPKRPAAFLQAVTEWKTNHVLLTRYIKGFEEHIKRDERIHTTYSITKAVTGRTASSRPNMQNNPKRSPESKKIRRLLVPEPGWCFLAVDLSQGELRWIAHIANEQNMIRVFRKGIDIHTYTAEKLMGQKLSDLTKEEKDLARFRAKAANFGCIYGISARGFQRYAKKDYGLELSEDEAQEWLDTFLLEMFPGLSVYHERYKKFCRSEGYVQSPFGRRRHLPNISSSNVMLRREAERQAINCVSYDTEILTDEGWKGAGDLRIGDKAFSVNTNNGALELCPVEKVNQTTVSNALMWIIDHASVSAVATYNHRWLVSSRGKGAIIKTTEQLTMDGHDKIWISADPYKSEETTWTDDAVLLLGWVLTDGYYKRQVSKKTGVEWGLHRVGVTQTKKQNLDELFSLFSRLGRHYHRLSKSGQHTWDITCEEGRRIREEMPCKTLKMKVILSLSSRQRRLLFQTMLKGDGCWDQQAGRYRKFIAGTKERADAFLSLCALIGQPARAHERDYTHYSPKKYASMGNVPKSTTCWIVELPVNTKAQPQYGSKWEKWSGKVWCPSLKYGTWVAKRNGKVFITGNSPVQTASSDGVLLSASELIDTKSLDPKEARIIAFVHDELVFEIKKKAGLVEKYFKRIKQALENPPTERFGFQMRVPLVCDGKVGLENLADMTEL